MLTDSFYLLPRILCPMAFAVKKCVIEKRISFLLNFGDKMKRVGSVH